MKMRSSVVGAALFVAGCSSSGDVDIGDENVAKTGAQLSDYADVWEGYAEAYEFADGSDKVSIALDEQGNGTLVVGDSAEPVVDADHPSRPGKEGLVPGFRYTVEAASVSGSRLSFFAQRSESFKGFCEAQTPYPAQPLASGAYSCLPSAASGGDGQTTCWIEPEGEPRLNVDCALLDACYLNTCVCTSAGCSNRAAVPVGDGVEYFTRLDASLSDGGNTMAGTLLPVRDVRLNVRLTRQ